MFGAKRQSQYICSEFLTSKISQIYFEYIWLISLTRIQKRENKQFLSSSLWFHLFLKPEQTYFHRFWETIFLALIKKIFLSTICFNHYQPKISQKGQKKYMHCGQEFRGLSWLGNRVLNNRVRREPQNLILSSIKSTCRVFYCALTQYMGV